MDGSNERPEGRPAARPMPVGSRATEDVNRETPPGAFLGRRRFHRAVRRAVRPGALVLVLALIAATGTATAQIAPSLTLSPTTGPAGTPVSASGVFGGHCGIRFFWDSVGGTFLGETSVGPDGNYAASIAVPGGATAGAHTVLGVGLAPDRDFVCAFQTSNVLAQPFVVTAADGPLTATLNLAAPHARPGEGVVLDASGSAGEIVSFDFDLDGNGSYETSCTDPGAVAVHNDRGSHTVGLRVVSADGAVAEDSVVLEIVGVPAPPPPDPDGGSPSPFEDDTIVGACMDDAQIPQDAIIQAWFCPETVIVGVAEATFRKWGINAADQDACFERTEVKLPALGFDIVTTSFVATKPSGPLWRQNPVLINGLEFAHPEGEFVKSYNDLAINETLEFLYSSGTKQIYDKYRWQISFRDAGLRTTFSSQPFLWPGWWDVSEAGAVGTFTLGSDQKEPINVNNEFLGLSIAEKQAPISFTAGHLAKLTLHLTPPFFEFQGISLPTASVTIFTENNGGHPVAFPAGALAPARRSSVAAPEFDLQFTGIKLGMFTMDASLSYQEEGGDDVWAGGMELTFPGGVGIGGDLVIRNGEFESAHFDYQPGPPGIGPIGCCVWIYELFGNLTTTSITAGADFGIGPVLPVIDVPPAAVTGEASIFYGDPWAFVLDVSNLEIVGISVDANANVLISSNGFIAQAFIDEDWGPLELQANVLMKMGSGTWFAGGGGTACIDIEVLEGCGGGWAGVGKGGIAACAQIPYFPDGGVALDWEFFTGDLLAWEMWWGCSFGDVESAASAPSLARAREAGGVASAAVHVGPGTPKVLFSIEGGGAAPKVAVSGPDGLEIASAPGEPLGSGPGWTLIELPHDDTTYVTVEDPAAGAWQVSEQPGSAPILSIGLAEGHPRRMATGRLTGEGRTRTLHYDLAEIEGMTVTFVERGGDPDAADPGEHVDRIIRTVRGGEGTLRFTPAEASVRNRTIEAEIHVDGIPVETETIASFTAPPLRSLSAPSIEIQRKNRGLMVHWATIPGASGYRLVIDRSDGPTDVIDVLAHRARVGGITARTSTTITVQAFTEAGYLGKVGTTTVRPG